MFPPYREHAWERKGKGAYDPLSPLLSLKFPGNLGTCGNG